MTDPTDEILVPLDQEEDMMAFDTLVRRHQSRAFNLALRMVWKREVAEDATQEIGTRNGFLARDRNQLLICRLNYHFKAVIRFCTILAG